LSEVEYLERELGEDYLSCEARKCVNILAHWRQLHRGEGGMNREIEIWV
jgi:hypothetical protein